VPPRKKKKRCQIYKKGMVEMEFYSVTKKNEILSFAGKWIELENILNKVNQAQKVKSHVFSLISRL
jgi:hypothetical protein